MKILSWNCRELGHPDSVLYLKSVIRQKQSDCMFLIETKVNKAKMDQKCRSLNFKNLLILEAMRIAGEIALMWIEETNIECLWKSNHLLHCIIKDSVGSRKWDLFACYGTPYYRAKKTFWDSLVEQVSKVDDPWLMIGDLNEVVDALEKFGGRPVWRKSLYLQTFLNDTGGVYLGFRGRKFTWTNGQEGLALIKERLDRAVVNDYWILHFPKATMEHLEMEMSDHCPILLHKDGEI